MIKLNNKQRNQIARARHGESNYYETIGHAIQHIDSCLNAIGLQLGIGVMLAGTGTNHIDLADLDGNPVETEHRVRCDLYRMPQSGRYELTWYVT